MTTGRLAGKVTLITGVASGIGREAACLFAAQGAQVFGVDRNLEGGEALAAHLHSQNLKFQFYSADLSQPKEVISVVEQCRQTYGSIDVLYNNAGISEVESFTDTSPESLERMLAINFKSAFYLCQQVVPLMQSQGGGVIINTASELSIVAQPRFTAYCASKGAVLSFTRALALEYAQHNIRINALCPGPIDTPMLDREFATETDFDQAKAESLATIPIRRLGRPEEIAQVALFLASDAPALLHGATLLIDGGKTIF